MTAGVEMMSAIHKHGNVTNLAAAVALVKELNALADTWNALCSYHLKMSRASYDTKVFGRDWVMNYAEALAVGAVDEVL